MNKTRLLAIFVLLLVVLVGCGGDDGEPEDTTTDPTPAPINPNVEIDLSLLGEGINSSRVPRGLLTNGGLTVVSKSEFVRDGILYLAYVVRNDSTEIHDTVIGVVTLVDDQDFHLETLNLSSPATHIPPSSTVVMQRSFDVTGYPLFDGLAVTILPDLLEVDLEATAYSSQVEGTFDTSTNLLSGEVTNTNEVTLQTVVAHFLLYDAAGNLLNTVPATLTTPLPSEGWSPNSTLIYSAAVPILPDREDATVARVELLIYGYEYETAN